MGLVGCRWELIALAALFAGCFEETPQQKARTVCETYCKCTVTEGRVEVCVVEQCLPVLPPVSDECLDCVVQNAQLCTALDAQCTDLCIDNSQP